MAFRDFEFSSKDMFPSHSDVLKYLQSFAKCNNLIRNIKFNTKVLSIDSSSDAAKEWTVVVHDLVTGVIETQVFSHVVICNGHYSYPRIPCISGILTFPGPVLHSQSYRDATRYQNLNVLVVGGSFSALDIVKEVSHVAKHVYCSVRDPAQQEYLVGKTDMANVTTVPFATLIEKDHVHFSTVSVPIDCIIFATGYYFRFPFLDESRLLSGISDGNQVNNLYLGLLHREFHNLAFVGLPFQTVPFMIAEYQAEYLRSLWSNEINLALEQCFYDYDQLEGRERHTLGYPFDFEYCTFLANIYGGEKHSLRKHQLRQTAKEQLRFHLGY